MWGSWFGGKSRGHRRGRDRCSPAGGTSGAHGENVQLPLGQGNQLLQGEDRSPAPSVKLVDMQPVGTEGHNEGHPVNLDAPAAKDGSFHSFLMDLW